MMVRKEMDSAMQNWTRLLDTANPECLHDRPSSLWYHEMGDLPSCAGHVWCSDF